MCKKSTLYEASADVVRLQKRSRGGKLNFQQVSYSADCVREFANIREIPMYVAIQQLQAVNAMSKIYRAAKEAPLVPARKLARSMATEMGM